MKSDIKPSRVGREVSSLGRHIPERRDTRRLRKMLVPVIVIALLLLAGIYLMVPGSTEHTTNTTVYALVELKTPQTLEELKSAGVKVVHIYDYYALVEYPESVSTRVANAPLHPVDYHLWFQTGKFDAANIPSIPEKYRATSNTELYVVQLIGPATPEWLAELRGYGVKIYRYYPNYAYLVRIKSTSVETIQNLPFVKGVYVYQPLWKMHSSLYREMMQGNATTLKLKINVDPSMDITTAANTLSTEYGAKIIKYFSYPKYDLAYVVAEVPKTQVSHILQADFVLSMDIQHEIHLTNAVAARIIGAAELRDAWMNGLGLPVTGASQVVAIADTGLDTGNPATVIPDFAGRVLTIYDAAGDGDPSDPDNGNLGGHGTHVAGSVASSGVMSGSDPTNHIYDGSFAGMAPEVKIHFESIGTSSGGLSYDSITNMATRSYQDGARIWTNSWGTSDNTYTSEADETDTFMWNHKDFLILFAAGNSGPGPNTVGSPATAKDILTVGATETLRMEVNSQGTWNAYSMAQNPDEMAYFSSRGPTADGLIKPDICAPGTGIVSDRPSTLSDANAVYTWVVPIDSNGDGLYDYGAMQGTSMATPVTAGAAVLVRDFLTRVDPAYDPVTGSVNISAALVKAIMIGGAEPLPGYKYQGIDQGYGRINIARALMPPPPLSYKYWDWRAVSNGASWSTTVDVKTSEAPLRVVLTWTDVNSGTGAGVAVNNLDLRIIAPNGTEYHGNTFIGDTQWSSANPTTYDSTNVVEVVNVKKPAVGTWTIQVVGASIGTDDPDVHAPGTLDQSFAVYALGPFGNLTYKNIKIERYDENMPYDSEYKDYTYKPIQKVLPVGGSTKIRFKVVNWGNVAMNYAIQSSVTPSVSGITVTFDKTSLTLNPGESAWVNSTISVAFGTSPMLYQVLLRAINTTYSLNASLTVNLQVISDSPIWHTQVTRNKVTEATSAIAVDPTDNSIWIAYFRQNESTTGNIHYSGNGNGDSYDLIVAHSTDGGVTWTEYIAYPNIDRFYNYGGTFEEVMDWFAWYARMTVDANGVVYVAFSNVTSMVVVYGNESGWSHTSFEAGYYKQVGGTWLNPEYQIIMVYPMFDIISTGPGSVYVVYTYRYYDFTRSAITGSTTVNGAYRALKYVYTTNGGATWSTPAQINTTYTTTDTNDEREYFPALAYDGNSIYVFFSYRNPGNGETSYYLRYYKYTAGTWSAATTINGTGTSGFNDLQPSAYYDSSGRLWVAWYSDEDKQNSYFGVTEHKIYMMYSTDGGATWSSVIKIDGVVPGLDINDFGPIPIGEDSKGNILVGFIEENSNYTSAPHNENWVYYRYSMKLAIVNATLGTVTGYKYIDYGGMPNYWLAGVSSGGEMYFSYTKTPERYDLEIFFAKYSLTATDDLGPSTYGTLVEPANSNNATKVIYIDLVYVKSLSLSAIVSDVESGNSTIAGAEYFIDAIGASGTGTALYATDGAFDSAVESVNITLDPFSLSRGYHRIYVHGRDANGNWGAYDYIDIYIYASKYRVYGYVYDSSGTPLANIAVNITDTVTGENVTVYTNASGYYEYYIDQFPHAYSIGDKILVYADDGSNPGAIDGTYYDTNTTSVSAAPGAAQLNLYLVSPVPEFGSWVVLLLVFVGAMLISLRKRK